MNWQDGSGWEGAMMGKRPIKFVPPYRRLRPIPMDTAQGTMMCFHEELRVDTLEQVNAMFEQLRKVHGLLEAALRCAEEACIVANDAITGKFSTFILQEALTRLVDTRRKIYEETPHFLAFLEQGEKPEGVVR